MADDRTLTLGTLFKGKVDDTFKNAISELESRVEKLGKTVAATLQRVASSQEAAAKSAKSISLGTDLTDFQKVAKKYVNESKKFQEALAELGTGKQGIQLGVIEGQLLKVEKAIQSKTAALNAAKQGGDDYAKSFDRVGTVLSILGGKSKILGDNIVATSRVMTPSSENLRLLGNQLTSFATVMDRAKNEAPKFVQAMSTLGAGKTERELSALERNMYGIEKAIKAKSVALNNAGKDGDKYADGVSRLSLYNAALAGRLKVTSDGFSVVSKATRDVEESSKRAATSTQQLAKSKLDLTAQVANASGAMERLSRAMKVVASFGVAGAIIYGLSSAFRKSVNDIIDFDQALKNMQAITGATNNQMIAMGETVKDVARGTKFSTGEVASGMTLIGQAGFNAAETMNTIRPAATLAMGTLSDLRLTTDLLTTTIMTFNLNTAEAGRVADVMANAMNKSKLTLDMLRVAFNYVGDIAKQAGMSLEETAASMMVLSNNGIRASTIGTGLRQVLGRLLAPNEKLREAFEAHGVAIDKINPATNGWKSSLEALTKTLFNAEKKSVDMSKAFELFGLRGAQAVSILIKSYVSGEFEKAIQATYDIGSAQEMMAKQSEGLRVKLQNLVSQLEVLAITLGEGGITNALKSIVDGLRGAVSALIGFGDSATSNMAITVAAWTAGAYGLIKVLGFLGSAISVVMAKLGAVGIAAGAISPWSALIIALAGIAATIYSLTGQTERYATSLAKQEAEVSKAVSGLEAYKGAIESLSKKYETGQDVGEEYIAILKRLIAEYPALKDQIDLTTTAWDKNAEAVKRAIGEEQRTQLAIIIKEIKAYGKAVEEATPKTGLGAFLADTFIGRGWLGLFSSAKDAAKSEKDLEESIKRATEALYKQFVAGKTLANIRHELTQLWAAGEISDDVYPKLLKAISDFAAKAKPEIKSFTDDAEERLRKLGSLGASAFTQMYAAATSINKPALVEEHKRMLNEIASYKKFAQEKKLTEQEVSEALAAIQVNHLLKMSDINKRAKENDQQEATRKVAALKVLEQAIDEHHARQLATEGITVEQMSRINMNYANTKKAIHENIGKVMKTLSEKDQVELQKLMDKVGDKAAKLEGTLENLEHKRTRDIEKAKGLHASEIEINAINAYYDAERLKITDKITEEKVRLLKIEYDTVGALVEQESLLRQIAERYAEGSPERLKIENDIRQINKDILADADKVVEGEIKRLALEGQTAKSLDLQRSLLKAMIERYPEFSAERIKAENDLYEFQQKHKIQTELPQFVMKEGINEYRYQLWLLEKEIQDFKDRLGTISTDSPIGFILEEYASARRTQIEREFGIWGQMSERTSKAMERNFSDFFFEAFTGKLRTLSDYMTAIFESIARAVSDILGQALANSLFGKMSGFNLSDLGRWFGKLYGRGGDVYGGYEPGPYGYGSDCGSGRTVGETSAPIRKASSALFLNAPKFHSGLKPNEFSAILQKGERALSKREASSGTGKTEAPGVIVTVNNQSGADIKQGSQSVSFKAGRWVVDVVLDAIHRDVGGLRTVLSAPR